MRKRLYSIVQKAEPGDRLSKLYDMFIIAVAFLSVLPLMFKGTHPVLEYIDLITVYILFGDYVFRWIVYDYTSDDPRRIAFLRYPFTPYAIVVMLSLLPSMGLLGPGFRMLRMLRIFTILHYSDNFRYIAQVFRKERRTLLSVLYIALFYIFLSALVMFAYEPDTFDSFFDALYWATTALTTVGYGDVYPLSAVGRLISMVSSLFGIAVIALPAGIVTAGFVDEISKNNARKEEQQHAFDDARAAFPPRLPLLSLTGRVKRYGLILLLCVALNWGLNRIAGYFNWPVWLDTTGTALAALLLEPTAGLMVGLISNMIEAIATYGTSSLFYYSISAAVALIAGVYIGKDGLRSPKRVVSGIAFAIIVSAGLSTLIDFWISGGAPPQTYWEHFFYNKAASASWPPLLANLAGELVVKTFDTLAVTGIVALLYRLLPKGWRSEE